MSKIFEVKAESELSKVAEFIKGSYDGGIFILVGDLGYGKTAFVRAFASLFGLEREVSSPTFAVMNEYGGKIFHYDFYNFGTDAYFEKGMFEYLEQGGWHFMEWADEKIEKFLQSIGMKFVRMVITKENETRFYRIENA
ncbi:MAG TPA: tRNA (adenosine(37)-N6)-threonylcarbamoyltransferase complex ATPase subunit type 1 TsaE [Campylobacterales bacterium]|nr:tRNA (adenosine(37)-N6)-threonylcarbamoyltransferase complex ATPase subunit type 1 TsaE [Campylobacterales bacterium]